MPVDTVARCRAVANAMITDINTEIAAKQSDGTAISPARFTAAVCYYPEWTAALLSDVRVDLRIVETTIDAESRNGIALNHEMEITIQKAMRWEEVAAINLLVDLACRIAKFYPENCEPCGADSSGHSSMVTALGANYPLECTGNVHTLYDPIRLRDYGTFWSMVALTWRENVSS